jgi:Mg2+ and Co2+ transporter CorA
MIKLRDLKELIINNEIEFIEQVQHEDPKMYIDGIKDKINFCDTIDDIVLFYEERGYGLHDAYKNIINLLMNSAQLK